jgi:hypothetical protein
VFSGSYWIVGLQPNFIAFTYFNLVILVAMAVGQAIVVMTSAATSDLQIGNAVVTALLALMFYFGGFFITLNDVRCPNQSHTNQTQLLLTLDSLCAYCMTLCVPKMPSYWKWFHYLSIFKYPLEGLLLSQYTHDIENCSCKLEFTIPSTGGACVVSRQAIIDYFDIQVSVLTNERVLRLRLRLILIDDAFGMIRLMIFLGNSPCRCCSCYSIARCRTCS